MKLLGTSTLLVLGLALAACGPETPEAEADETGTVNLRFSASDGVRESSNLDAPLVGNLYGGLFFASEVNVFGPLDGAEQYGEIELLDVDLEANEVSAQVWTSGPLVGNTYSFLGFLDVDDNDADDKDPDGGDPVTFPGTTDFDVFEGEDLDYTLEFSMVR